MPLAITSEQRQLADAVTQFAARHAPVDKTRAMSDSLVAGELPSWWADFVAQGFHSVHLPEAVGGQGGRLSDMACVLDAAGSALLAGPVLSTAIAGAVIISADQTESAVTLAAELVAGTTATVVLPEHSDFTATADGDGWRVSGTSGLTLGACSGQRVIVAASTGDDTLMWFVLDALCGDSASPSVKVEQRLGTDIVSDVGVLDLDDHAVTADSVLTGIDIDRARAIVVTLTACTTAGIVRWALDAATEYMRSREQFGNLIGTFQALQHKAAMLLVNAELAAAGAWDAARAADESLDQHRLAAASAAVTSVSPAPDLVLEAMMLFGAIGYTWEHDLHLYWRRATSLAASVGPLTGWARDVAELTRINRRAASLNLGDAEAAFRAEVAALLEQASTLPNERPAIGLRARAEGRTGAQRDLLAEARLVAPHWPAPWGRDASPLQQVIIAEEFEKRPDVPRPYVGIAEWIMPAILAAGAESLHRRFLPATLRGQMQWCQLFSEPEAGSDLASLRTRAARVEGGWLINGHKIWTSSANEADFGGLLARTDPEASKHRGLSYFVVDMRSPGIEVRPIKQASGHSEFNEVFLTDVFIPDDMLLGAPGDGWGLAIGTMAQERVSISNHVAIDRAGALRQVVETESVDHDAALRALGEIDAATNAIKALGLRETLQLIQGGSPGPASSIAKVAFSLLLRRIASATLQMTGRNAMVQESEPAVVGPYFDLPAELIGGGTLEIQLNIIARMILGLPRK